MTDIEIERITLHNRKLGEIVSLELQLFKLVEEKDFNKAQEILDEIETIREAYKNEDW